MNSAIQRERLLLGLLTDPAQMQLYHSNLLFRGAIDNLAALLPSWVEGLVVTTGRAEIERIQMTDFGRTGHQVHVETKDPDVKLLHTVFGLPFPDQDE